MPLTSQSIFRSINDSEGNDPLGGGAAGGLSGGSAAGASVPAHAANMTPKAQIRATRSRDFLLA